MVNRILSILLPICIPAIVSAIDIDNQDGEEPVRGSIIDYAIDYSSDINALIWLFTSEREGKPRDIDELFEFVGEHEFVHSIKPGDSIDIVWENDKTIISFVLKSTQKGEHKLDTGLKLETLRASFFYGPPVSEGSSIRSLEGVIDYAELIEESGDIVIVEKIELPYMFTRVSMERVERFYGREEQIFEPGTPEDVLTRYEQAIKKMDWEQAAELMHPEGLNRVYSVIRAIMEEGLDDEFIDSILGDIESPEEFDQLIPETVYAKFLEGTLGASLELQMIIGSSHSRILGVVNETEELLHVVSRVTVSINGTTFSDLDVSSLKLDGDEWRVMLGEEFEELLEQLRRQAMY